MTNITRDIIQTTCILMTKTRRNNFSFRGQIIVNTITNYLIVCKWNLLTNIRNILQILSQFIWFNVNPWISWSSSISDTKSFCSPPPYYRNWHLWVQPRFHWSFPCHLQNHVDSVWSWSLGRNHADSALSWSSGKYQPFACHLQNHVDFDFSWNAACWSPYQPRTVQRD